MKSIFKKLAFVLALAMVVTMLPGRAVSAAEEDGPQMYKSLLLYLDNGNGMNSDITGTYKSERYASVWNWRESGYTSVTFESADPSIATVGSKGLVTAVKVGTTTVTATFTADDMETVEKTCKVTVKRNASKVGLSAESAKQVEEGIKVGEKVQLTGIRKDVDGNTEWNRDMRDYTTDAVRFVSLTPEIFTVAKTNGMLTAVSEGEGVLKVWSVQSEGFDGKEYPEVVSKEYTVKVVSGDPVVKSASVKSVYDIVLEVVGVTAENVKDLKITNQYGGDIKAIFADPVLNEDGTVTVKKYASLTNDEQLNFAYGDQEPVALTVKIGEIDKIVLTGPFTAVVGEPTKVNILVLDANNIELDIPAGLVVTTSDEIFSTVDNSATDKKVTIYQLGQKVELEASYATGKFDENWNEIKITSNKITVEGVDAAAITAGTIQYGLMNADNSVVAEVGTNAVTIYEGTTGVKLSTKVVLSNDSEVNNAGVTFETLDPTVLLVDAATGTLAPVKAGTARILMVFDYSGIKMTSVATVVVRANQNLVSVVPDQQAVTISNATTTVSGSAVGIESKAVTFTGKDQYSQDYGVTVNRVESLARPNGVTAEQAEAYVKGVGVDNKITFEGQEQPAGVYTYRVWVNNNAVSTIVSNTVKAPNKTAAQVDEASSYRFVPVNGSDNVTIDPANITNMDSAKYSFRVVALDSAGVAYAIVQDDLTGSSNFDVKSGNTSLKNRVVFADGVYTVDFSENKTVSGSATTMDTTKYSVIVGGNGYDVNEGSFVITAQRTVGSVTRNVVPATVNVSIKKNAPTVKVKTRVLTSTAANYINDIIAQLEVDTNKYEGLAIVDGDYVNTLTGTGTSYVLVKNVKVYEKTGNGNYILHTVALNEYFSVKLQ